MMQYNPRTNKKIKPKQQNKYLYIYIYIFTHKKKQKYSMNRCVCVCLFMMSLPPGPKTEWKQSSRLARVLETKENDRSCKIHETFWFFWFQHLFPGLTESKDIEIIFAAWAVWAYAMFFLPVKKNDKETTNFQILGKS